MKKYTKIIIILIAIVLLLLIVFKVIHQNNNKNEEPESNISYVVDEEKEKYVLYKEDGTEIDRADDKEALKIYEYNENYDPKLPLEESGIDVKKYKVDN